LCAGDKSYPRQTREAVRRGQKLKKLKKSKIIQKNSKILKTLKTINIRFLWPFYHT
jgi:hypothetical protein